MSRKASSISSGTVCAGVAIFSLPIRAGLFSIMLAVVRSPEWCPGCVEGEFDCQDPETAPRL